MNSKHKIEKPTIGFRQNLSNLITHGRHTSNINPYVLRIYKLINNPKLKKKTHKIETKTNQPLIKDKHNNMINPSNKH
jgi:hypothetical protein